MAMAQALLTFNSAAFVADYPSGVFRGLAAYEKHQRKAMKWASCLLQHQLVGADGPIVAHGDSVGAPWEFEYTMSMDLASHVQRCRVVTPNPRSNFDDHEHWRHRQVEVSPRSSAYGHPPMAWHGSAAPCWLTARLRTPAGREPGPADESIV